MLRRRDGRPHCPILSILDAPATKGPQEGKRVGDLRQVPYAKIVNGKSRLDLHRIKREELIPALEKGKINLFLLLTMGCV